MSHQFRREIYWNYTLKILAPGKGRIDASAYIRFDTNISSECPSPLNLPTINRRVGK